MLYTLVVILFALWLLGMLAGVTMHGIIHVFLGVAIVMLLFNLLSGRKPVV